jgi:arginase
VCFRCDCRRAPQAGLSVAVIERGDIVDHFLQRTVTEAPAIPRPTLLGIPFDRRSSFAAGAARGPAAIREALRSPATNSWSESGIDVGDVIVDAGDVEIPSGDEGDVITRAVRQLPSDACPIILGGDHSITFPVLRALTARHGLLHILDLDAHADLYPDFEGDPRSHACVFARVMECGLAASLTQVGVRTLNAVQEVEAGRHGVRIIDMQSWWRGTRPSIAGPLYLSLDMDVFDPAFAPGVAHREAGGLMPRDVIALIQDLRVPILGADIVEMNPMFDKDGITAPLAAKLVKEIVAKMIA